MADSDSEREEERNDIRDLLLIIIGILLTAGVQAFMEAVKIIFYPQFFPNGIYITDYFATQSMIFFGSIVLAAFLVSRLPTLHKKRKHTKPTREPTLNASTGAPKI